MRSVEFRAIIADKNFAPQQGRSVRMAPRARYDLAANRPKLPEKRLWERVLRGMGKRNAIRQKNFIERVDFQSGPGL